VARLQAHLAEPHSRGGFCRNGSSPGFAVRPQSFHGRATSAVDAAAPRLAGKEMLPVAAREQGKVVQQVIGGQCLVRVYSSDLQKDAGVAGTTPPIQIPHSAIRTACAASVGRCDIQSDRACRRGTTAGAADRWWRRCCQENGPLVEMEAYKTHRTAASTLLGIDGDTRRAAEKAQQLQKLPPRPEYIIGVSTPIAQQTNLAQAINEQRRRSGSPLGINRMKKQRRHPLAYQQAPAQLATRWASDLGQRGMMTAQALEPE
jgi:hypothetical protein